MQSKVTAFRSLLIKSNYPRTFWNPLEHSDFLHFQSKLLEAVTLDWIGIFQLFPRTVPAVCVIFLEPPKPKYPKHEYGYGYEHPKHPPVPIRKPPVPFTTRLKNYFRSLKYRKRLLKKRDTGYGYPKTTKKPRVHLQEVISFERRYGFRCRVTLVDRQQCQLGVSCDSEGNRLSDRKVQKRQKRQAGEEFFADGPPECRTELSPLGCTPLRKTTQ